MEKIVPICSPFSICRTISSQAFLSEGMSNWRVTTKQKFHGLDQHLADDLFEGADLLRGILQIMEEDCGT